MEDAFEDISLDSNEIPRLKEKASHYEIVRWIKTLGCYARAE